MRHANAANATRTPPAIKIHGGQFYTAKAIVKLMPPRDQWCHYCEPYFGGGSVLFANDPEGISECVNDIDGDLVNFWATLQDPERFWALLRECETTPFSEEAFHGATAYGGTDPVTRAWAFFVQCRMSLAGRRKQFAPLSKTRTRRGMNEQASAWLTAIDGLPAVHERLKRVVILGPRDGVDVIKQQDGPTTLFYLDPPFFPDTRTSPNIYAHEMTREQHEHLLKVITACRAKVMLSGYPCDLYDHYLGDWNRTTWKLANHAAGTGTKRTMTTCLWRNFTTPRTTRH